jgi:hypothetical protein
MPEYILASLNFSSATTPELILKTFTQFCEIIDSPDGLVMQPNHNSYNINQWIVIFCDEIVIDGDCNIVQSFYKIFSDWDWATYGLVINSKHPPLKLTKLEIAQAANDTSMKFTMLVDTYGACSSCTVWPDTLYQIQKVFRLNYLAPIYANASATISKLVINGNFSERGLAKKIQMITKAFRRNINCDYAYSHYTSQLLIYPEPCIEGIIICVNMAHFFTGLNYNKFLAIANGVIANESMHW